MSGFSPNAAPSFPPARFKVFDAHSCGRSLVFEVHIEHGQHVHDEQGNLCEYASLSARLAGISQVTVACFGIWVVAVAAYCEQGEAREVVRRWAAEMARYIGTVREGLAQKAMGGGQHA